MKVRMVGAALSLTVIAGCAALDGDRINTLGEGAAPQSSRAAAIGRPESPLVVRTLSRTQNGATASTNPTSTLGLDCLRELAPNTGWFRVIEDQDHVDRPIGSAPALDCLVVETEPVHLVQVADSGTLLLARQSIDVGGHVVSTRVTCTATVSLVREMNGINVRVASGTGTGDLTRKSTDFAGTYGHANLLGRETTEITADDERAVVRLAVSRALQKLIATGAMARLVTDEPDVLSPASVKKEIALNRTLPDGLQPRNP